MYVSSNGLSYYYGYVSLRILSYLSVYFNGSSNHLSPPKDKLTNMSHQTIA